jgi:hypothetical protein
MKCLSEAESQEWLASLGANIVRSKPLLSSDICFSNSQTRQFLTTNWPVKTLQLTRWSIRLVNWLPTNRQHMLWLKNWDTDPSEPYLFFEQIRSGYGEKRDIIESRGHVFGSEKDSSHSNTGRSDNQEEVTMSGLVFLTMCFNWDAYLLAKGSTDYICLQDELTIFSSESQDRIKQANELLELFKLRRVTRDDYG